MIMKRLLILFIFILAACTREASSRYVSCKLILIPHVASTRAGVPDEGLITDYNLFIFNSLGILEESCYVSARQLKKDHGLVVHNSRLLLDAPYTVLLAANLGFELKISSLEQARSYRYYLAYPDEYSRGIPMAYSGEGVRIGEDGQLELPLERLMARIDLQLDRSALDQDVRIKVTQVRVAGCPSSVLLFSPSKAQTAAQVFPLGFMREGSAVSALNEEITLGHSKTLSLYLLENLQGDLLDNVQADSDKVLTDGLYNQVCSYIEIQADYHSSAWHTQAGGKLVYRFYLGENLNNFDVVRNGLYRITVRLKGDGLLEESWRIDKSALVPGA